jgi:cation transporter-like permease
MPAKYFNKIMKESLPTVFITTLIVSFSGTVLSVNEDMLATIPILLLIVPILNDLFGDLIIVFVSRLSVHFVLGTIPMKFTWSKQIKEDYTGLLITLILSLSYMILLSFGYALIMNIEIYKPLVIIFIIFLCGMVVFHVAFFLYFFLSYLAVTKDKDPNNVVLPYITSVADFSTPIVLIAFVIMFI